MTVTEPDLKDPEAKRSGRHWLKPAGKTWTPGVVGFFDTETVPVTVGGTEVQRLRLWCASVVVRRHQNPRRVGASSARGETGAELAAFVTEALGRHDSAWLFAHNLGFDLTVSRLLTRLADAGWALSSVAMTGKSAVVRLRRGRSNLCLVDSCSWFPCPLRELGALVGTEKPPLPDWADSDDAWHYRCAQDVEILGKAVIELLDWWDERQMGHFSITGAGTAFSTVRRHLRPYTVMADPDPEVRRFERRAIYGGRRDLTTWGPQSAGPWVALDFENAYPTMAGHLALPCVPKGWVPDPARLIDAEPAELAGCMAEVDIEATAIRWPTRVGPDVVLPVGGFRTILAGPELAQAQQMGAVRQVHRARRYWTYPALVDWSAWVLDVVHQRTRTDPGVVQVAAKAWSRSGLGKFAGRTSEAHARGPAWSQGWSAARGWDHHAGSPALLVELAGRRLWMVRDLETMTAVPAIFAWIESAVRLRLRAVLDALGEGTWVQADTDGVLCAVPALRRWLRGQGVATAGLRSAMAVAGAACDLLVEHCPPLVLRPKELYHHIETIGPQHMSLGSGRKASGVRTDAAASGPRTYTGRTWPGLLWQMERGSREGYVRPKAVWHLPAVTAHRWALATGDLVPLESRLRPDGGFELLRWPETSYAASGAILGPSQWSGLEGLA